MARKLAGGAAAWTPWGFGIRINAATGTSAEEFLTDLTLGFEAVLESATWVASGDGAGAGATRTLRVVKGASTVAASGTVALADTNTKGEKVALTPATDIADRTFGPEDTLTVDLAAGGTQFTTLTGNVILIFRSRGQTAD